MALRENERRILAEIEHRLSQDDPELAGHLSSFGQDDGSLAPAPEPDGGWKPWLVCGAIAVTVIGLLVALFLATPATAADPAPPLPSAAPESIAPEPDSVTP